LYNAKKEIDLVTSSLNLLKMNSPTKTTARDILMSPGNKTAQNNTYTDFSRSTYKVEFLSRTKNFSRNNFLIDRNRDMNNNLEEEMFVSYLKDCLIYEREIERLKCNLTFKPDFNLGDLYKIFEINRLGYLTANDLKQGLYLFNVFSAMTEISLLIKRYDNSNTLRY